MIGKRDKKKALAKFQELINKIQKIQSSADTMNEAYQKNLLPAKVPSYIKINDFQTWQYDVITTITTYFSEKSLYLQKFNEIQYVTKEAKYKPFTTGLSQASILLRAIYSEIEDFEEESVNSISKSSKKKVNSNNKIFVIHGHSDAIREKVARYLEKADIEPIILHEQANNGRTIIEKLEHHADVGYAIALWTADDVGKSKTEKEDKNRARQNVIFETGYFVGLLGRNRVAILYEPGVEMPSDYDGVVYIELDKKDGWHLKLAKDIKSSGIDIDLNKLI